VPPNAFRFPFHQSYEITDFPPEVLEQKSAEYFGMAVPWRMLA